MKFLASAIATAALILSGLVAVPTTANAAGPYPGTVPTTCFVNANNVRRGKRIKATYRVRTPGNGRAVGLVRLRLYKNGRLVKYRALSYRGPRSVTVRMGTHRVGRYVLRMTFRADPDSVYRNCADSDGVRVYKKKRR